MRATLPAAAFTARTLPLPATLAAISTTAVSRRTGATRRRGYTGADPGSVRLYYLLQLYARPDGSGAITSADICRRLNVSRMTAWRSLRRLVGLRIVLVSRHQLGRFATIRFLLREVHRLWNAGGTRVLNGVLAFCLSFPQDVYPPHAYLTPPRGLKSRETTKDACASIRSPGRLLERLRKAAAANGLADDPRTAALLSTVGHLAFRSGRFAEFAAYSSAVDELEAHIASGFHGGPPARDCSDLQRATGYPEGTYEHRVKGFREEPAAATSKPRDAARRVWAWARATVEDALIGAKIGRSEARVAMLSGSAAISHAQSRFRDERPVEFVPFGRSETPSEAREFVSGVFSGGGVMSLDDLDRAAAERARARRDAVRPVRAWRPSVRPGGA